MASPSLVNESNLIVKKLGWRFAAATLLLGLSPLLSLGGGMAVTVSSLLVCFSNAAKLLLYSQLGEQQVKNTRKEYLRKHGVGRTLV